MSRYDDGRSFSAVPRVAGTRFVRIRADLLQIIRGHSDELKPSSQDTGAAALLDQLIYFADLADWQPFEKSFPKLEEAIMWMRCQKTIREQILPKLEELGFVSYQQDQGQETVITVNLEAINEALSKTYSSQTQHWKRFQSTLEKIPEHTGRTSTVEPAPSLVGVKDSKDIKDSPLPPNGGDAEIVSFLQDQAIKHSVKLRLTGKQKDWLRENESDELRLAVRAVQVMIAHRGRRVNVTDAIMAAVGYSGRAGPAGGSGARRQFTPRPPKPKPKPPGYDFEAKLLADGKISQKEWEELRVQD